MAETVDREQDPALEALTTLSEAAAASARELTLLDHEFAAMRRRRYRGWSWRQIFASARSAEMLSCAARIVAHLGRATGGFRRAAARALRSEGMQVVQIAALLEVSRQRVSALVRPKRTG
jgi:hypothetical protein